MLREIWRLGGNEQNSKAHQSNDRNFRVPIDLHVPKQRHRPAKLLIPYRSHSADGTWQGLTGKQSPSQ